MIKNMETLATEEFVELALRSDIPSLISWYNTNSYYRNILKDSRVLTALAKQHHLERVTTFQEFVRAYYVRHPSLDALEFLPLEEYATLLSREFKVDELLGLLVDSSRVQEVDQLLSRFFVDGEVLEDALLTSLAREEYELSYVLLSYLPEYTSEVPGSEFEYPDAVLQAMRNAPPDLWKLVLSKDRSRRANFYVVTAAVRSEDEEFMRDIIPHISLDFLYLLVDWAVENSNGRLLSYIHKNMDHPEILAGLILGSAVEQENEVWMMKAVQLYALNISNVYRRLLNEGKEELAATLRGLTKIYRDPKSTSYNPRHGEDLERRLENIHRTWRQGMR